MGFWTAISHSETKMNVSSIRDITVAVIGSQKSSLIRTLVSFQFECAMLLFLRPHPTCRDWCHRMSCCFLIKLIRLHIWKPTGMKLSTKNDAVFHNSFFIVYINPNSLKYLVVVNYDAIRFQELLWIKDVFIRIHLQTN